MPEPWEITWRDYYAILGVDTEASTQEVNAAFRARAWEAHPDRFVGAAPRIIADAEERFKLINEAYDVLRSVDSRSAYDDARVYGHPARATLIVHSPEVRLHSATKIFQVRSAIELSGADPSQFTIEVTCDDPDLELRAVDVRPFARGETTRLFTSVSGAVTAGASRSIVLTYHAGGASAEQQLDLRLPRLRLPVLRGPENLGARIGGVLILAGLACFVPAVVFGLFAPTQPIALVLFPLGGGALALGALLALIAFFRAPGWTRRLLPGSIGFIWLCYVAVRIVFALIASLH